MGIENDITLLEAKLKKTHELIKVLIHKTAIPEKLREKLCDQVDFIQEMYIHDYSDCVQYPDEHDSNWMEKL
jgi:hypothetical protein